MRIIPGQVALITGASRGLGVYIAKTFARYGVNMMISARSEPELKKLQDELQQLGVRAEIFVADVASHQDLQNLYTATMASFGQIDILVNNAGIETWGKYKDLGADEITKVIDVNLTAPMLLTHLALPDMYRRDVGHIISRRVSAALFRTLCHNKSWPDRVYTIRSIKRPGRWQSCECQLHSARLHG